MCEDTYETDPVWQGSVLALELAETEFDLQALVGRPKDNREGVHATTRVLSWSRNDRKRNPGEGRSTSNSTCICAQTLEEWSATRRSPMRALV
jgi:hypothetical protein